jgi:predicted lipid-binding transport protein (Tim44 family)
MTGKTTSAKSAAFLQALSSPPAAGVEDKPAAEKAANAPKRARTSKPAASSREGLKHIGGYFNRADVEKIAVLRARLGLDNSQLIALAIDELYKKHEAKRAFGDT